MVDGFPTLRSFVKGQEIVISKTLINDLLKFSNVSDDSTPNIVALQNAKDMFILDSHSDFSPTKQLTHNALNLCGKLLHSLLVKTVFPHNSSCEHVTDAHLILIWKIVSLKNVDYASLIISTIRFCSSPVRNSSLPYANLLTLIFDHFNLLSDLEEVDFSGPQFLSSNVLPPLGIFKVHGKYELYSQLSLSEKEDLQKIHGKRLSHLEPQLKEHTTLSRFQSLDSEVSEMKISILDLHDKVSTLTFMLDTFMKELKGMVVEDVVVEEEEVDKGADAEKMEDAIKEEVKEKAEEKEAAEEEKKEKEKAEEENAKVVYATPIQTIPPSVEATPITTSPGKPKPSKKRKTRSRK